MITDWSHFGQAPFLLFFPLSSRLSKKSANSSALAHNTFCAVICSSQLFHLMCSTRFRFQTEFLLLRKQSGSSHPIGLTKQVIVSQTTTRYNVSSDIFIHLSGLWCTCTRETVVDMLLQVELFFKEEKHHLKHINVYKLGLAINLLIFFIHFISITHILTSYKFMSKSESFD